MLVVGLTGGIGAGKSTAAARFGELGAAVIDVDAIGREVLASGGRAESGVVDVFGPGILDEDGCIDRGKVAAEVFGRPDRLAALEAISHPAINAELDMQLRDMADGGEIQVVVLDMAVLTESRLGQLESGRGYTKVVVVEAPEEVRLPRLLERGLTEDQARARIGSQATNAQRRAIADHVIVNDGTPEELAAAVDQIWAELTGE
ncbi:MAG: dephospho-CoA kinase [Acidimicrobiia bacterium]|nr:dephospho-CoA kinase [Acidimicrobiia bacterium]MYB72469.1 dephospho-CoA kinase [Acidimicrobiia bacterium]MYH95733.1 dephospho-CoA kinase [Acidimicrobiia bacterium]MYH98348.1 dephospho-CoA kinase [Acidimicrobiia bacterium]MYL10456.1 dephospho-CoA kinase [Acidimicrobiia bacterium]